MNTQLPPGWSNGFFSGSKEIRDDLFVKNFSVFRLYYCQDAGYVDQVGICWLGDNQMGEDEFGIAAWEVPMAFGDLRARLYLCEEMAMVVLNSASAELRGQPAKLPKAVSATRKPK